MTWQHFLVLLGTVVLVTFPRVALGLNTFFYRDFGALGYPQAHYFRESLLRGELPFWNPYSHCGVPLLAQMGSWYPPALLLHLLPLPWSLNFGILLHLVWGGLGMFWLVRCWGASPFAASVAGFAFVFNGVTFSCLTWGNYIASLAWMPWLVGSVRAAWKVGGRWVVLASLAAALQVLTATPEITLLNWLLMGLLWIMSVGAGEARWLPSLARLGAVVVLAAGITMVQMLPFLDLLAHSQRALQNVESGKWAMPGWGWANLLVPLFHTYRAPQGQGYQPFQEFLVSYYLGAGALALAAAGLVLRRTRAMAVVAVTALLCWVLALGSVGVAYDWLRRILPVIGVARFPIKFTILTAFLVPVLVAWGVDGVQTNGAKARRVLGGVVAAELLLTVLLLTWAKLHPFPYDNWPATARNSAGRVAFLLVLVGAVCGQAGRRGTPARIALQGVVLAVFPLDALTHNTNLAPTIAAPHLAPGLWQARGHPPPPKLGEGRIMLSPAAEQRLNYSRVADFAEDFTAKRLAGWYNLNLLDGIPKLTGAFTLRPAHFDVLERHLYYTPGAQYGEPLLDFLSVALVSAPDNPTKWRARPHSLPVLTAGQRPVFTSDGETLQAITAADFDPRQVVYLPEASRSVVTVSNATPCVIRHARFRAHRIEAEVETAGPSLVVLSQTFYHFWVARVDGEVTPLLRANLAFQALEVPPGTHRIELVYRDPNFVAGGAISLAALGICAVGWSRSGRLNLGEEPPTRPTGPAAAAETSAP